MVVTKHLALICPLRSIVLGSVGLIGASLCVSVLEDKKEIPNKCCVEKVENEVAAAYGLLLPHLAISLSSSRASPPLLHRSVTRSLSSQTRSRQQTGYFSPHFFLFKVMAINVDHITVSRVLSRFIPLSLSVASAIIMARSGSSSYKLRVTDYTTLLLFIIAHTVAAFHSLVSIFIPPHGWYARANFVANVIVLNALCMTWVSVLIIYDLTEQGSPVHGCSAVCLQYSFFCDSSRKAIVTAGFCILGYFWHVVYSVRLTDH